MSGLQGTKVIVIVINSFRYRGGENARADSRTKCRQQSTKRRKAGYEIAVEEDEANQHLRFRSVFAEKLFSVSSEVADFLGCDGKS